MKPLSQWTLLILILMMCSLNGCSKPCEDGGWWQCRKLANGINYNGNASDREVAVKALADACSPTSYAACKRVKQALLAHRNDLNDDEVTDYANALMNACRPPDSDEDVDRQDDGDGEDHTNKTTVKFCDLLLKVASTVSTDEPSYKAIMSATTTSCITEAYKPLCETAIPYFNLKKTNLSAVDDVLFTLQHLFVTSACKSGIADMCEYQEAYDQEEQRREREKERRERERKEREAREERIRTGMRTGNLDCNEWAGSSARTNKIQMCNYLADTVREGRTSHESRRFMQKYLRDELGVRRISAFMIAKIDDNLYECVMLGYNSYFGVHYPRGKHFLMKTIVTAYQSRGRFHAWVTKVGTEDIETKNGFQETWNVYEESKIGGLWGLVRHAKAGYETSHAATQMLQVLR